LSPSDVTEPFTLDMLSRPEYQYKPPGPGDVRSSCPYTSACANHGIIPRDGKNVHFESLYRCAHFGGFGKTLFKTTRNGLAKIAKLLRKQDTTNGVPKEKRHPKDRVSLQETALYGPIQHDIALMYPDTKDIKNQNLVEEVKPDHGLLKQLLSLATKRKECKVKITDAWMDSTADEKQDPNCFLNLEDIIDWIAIRNQQERKWHEEMKPPRPINHGFTAVTNGAGETVFLLHLMGRNGVVNLQHAKVFLWNQRFPKDWIPPPTIGFGDFLAKVFVVSAKYFFAAHRKPNTESGEAEVKVHIDEARLKAHIDVSAYAGKCDDNLTVDVCKMKIDESDKFDEKDK